MANSFAHIDLVQAGKPFKPKSRPVPPKKTDRVHKDFAEEQIPRINSIIDKHVPILEDGYENDLVFKIKTIGKAPDSTFRNELRLIDVKTLVSSGKSADSKHDSEWWVSAIDPDLKKLKEKILKRATDDNYSLIDRIKFISGIKKTDKVGAALRHKPLEDNTYEKVTVDLMAEMHIKDKKKISSLENSIKKLAKKHNCKIHSKLKTQNLNVILMDCNNLLLDDLIKRDHVIRIDRLTKFDLDKITDSMVGINLKIKRRSSVNVGILVLDSGIRKHRMLNQALSAKRFGLGNRNITNDEMRHGTMVAGCALYGSLEDIRARKILDSKFNIYSGKIFWERNNQTLHDPSRHYTTIVKECVDEASQLNDCKVVNISFGDERESLYDIVQPIFSTLVDDLSIEHPNMIFTVSAGNLDRKPRSDYLDHMTDKELNAFRITSPASSIHALSVGSLKRVENNALVPSDEAKIGPGFNDMIKPDVVEVGGSANALIPVLNPDLGDIIIKKSGTSFSTPIVANHIAELINEHQGASRNMIISLLLSSCYYPSIPERLSGRYPRLTVNSPTRDVLRRTRTYGYGIPNLSRAIRSSPNRVLLKHDGRIKGGTVQHFEIKIPAEFSTIGNRHTISVSLAYDPDVDRTRSDYSRTELEFHLYRNRTSEEVIKKLAFNSDTDENPVDDLKKDEIKLSPLPRLRKLSPHQVGTRDLTSYKINHLKPIVLIVTCRDKWGGKSTVMQPYAISVIFENNAVDDLYQKIRRLNLQGKVARTKI